MDKKPTFSEAFFDLVDSVGTAMVGIALHAYTFATLAVLACAPLALAAQGVIYLRTGIFPQSICELHEASGFEPGLTTASCFRPDTDWLGFNELVAWALTEAHASLVIAAAGLAMLAIAAVPLVIVEGRG